MTQNASALRILHLRNADLLGGPERLILGSCQHAGEGVETHIASFVTRGRRNPLLEEADRLGLACSPIDQRGSYDRKIAGRVAALIDAVHPDVLVGHDYKANFVLRRAAALRPLPRAAIVHGYTAENLKVRLFERWDRRHLHEAQAVIAVSEAMVATLRDAGVPGDRLFVVPNAIDVDGVARAAAGGRASIRAAWNIAENETVALALGRLSPEKGGAVLLEALASLPDAAPGDRRIRLVFAGDGAERAALEARAERPDLAGRVVFAGWRNDPWACLGAADLFVLPSHREGMPLALLEALAAGVPVLATDVGSVAQVLEEGRLGQIVPPGDASALAVALGRHLQEPNSGAGAADRVAHVRAHYAPEIRAQRLASIYGALTAAGVR